MLYLDYAKQTENGYIMNFFANSVEDLEDISEGKEFVTKNGTNYGVPAPQSVVTITNKDGEKTTYLMGEDGNWIPGVVNPTDYYTKKQADEKFAGKEEMEAISQDVSTLERQVAQIVLYNHKIAYTNINGDIFGYSTFYSSNNLQCSSLTDLKTLLGDNFNIAVYPISGYLINNWIPLSLDNSHMMILSIGSGAAETNVLSYDGFTITDTVTAI